MSCPLELFKLTFPDPVKLSAPLRFEPQTNHTIAFRPYGDFTTASKLIFTVHGLTGDSLNFHYLSEYFLSKNSGYAIINIDIMGRGESQDRTQDPIDPKHFLYLQYIDDIVFILKSIRAQNPNPDLKFYWVGTSMGALLGMILSCHAADLAAANIKFNALMFNDIGPLVPWSEVERIAQYVVMDAAFESRVQAVDYFDKIYKAHFGPKVDTQFFAHRALYALHKNHLGELKVGYDRIGVAHGLLDQSAGQLIEHPTIGQALSFQSHFDQLAVPLMVYRGRLSQLLPQVVLDEMAESYAKRDLEFKSIVWDDTGHVPPLYLHEELKPLFEWFEQF